MEQTQQHSVKSFQKMLIRAKISLLNNTNVIVLNNKITTIMPI